MRLCADGKATGDIMETLLALMVVCAGILLLVSALPALLAASPRPIHPADDMTTLLTEDGVLDLNRAERTMSSLPEGTTVRLIMADGSSLCLLAGPSTEGDRFVARTPVLVRSAGTDFPAILEVACAG